jgi:hypothetical protein
MNEIIIGKDRQRMKKEATVQALSLYGVGCGSNHDSLRFVWLCVCMSAGSKQFNEIHFGKQNASLS